MSFHKSIDQTIESVEHPSSNLKISSLHTKKLSIPSNTSQPPKKLMPGVEEESSIQLNPETFQYDINMLKPENLFEVLEMRNDIDILCIKAKNAHVKYDVSKAYDIAVK